ncbi:putative serine protease K12H4.7 [Zerene cesonia]|uniref:putative serine protease K12H4.7 n=1 Tax=Zerene cesonia TaxID=33412 RepID=UPI0018E59FA8|nr:putative serine protease K12H4.7 [Zerene cesonia]
MNLLIFSLLLFNLQYVRCIDFDSGYHHLIEVILHILSNADMETTTETRWIEQPLDHFKSNSQTWKMRYFERLDHFKPNGPIYVFLGGEGEANPSYLSVGTVFELAEETNGAMFMTEHRYYGMSKPFNDSTTENMKWLSSRQALADIARLLQHIKSNSIFIKSKVVLIGGSYAGNLAAWMRLKYPQLVDAAIASSGPVLAKKDFYEYLEKVNDNYDQYGTTNCWKTTQQMFKRYQEMLQSSQGIEQLKREHNICQENDLTDVKNQWIFFMSKISPYMTKSQYGGQKEIKKHCYYIEIIERLQKFKFFEKLVWDSRDDCNDVTFDGLITYLNQTDFYHSWFYQVCTEFGYFQTTSSEDQPFGDVLPTGYYLEICKQLFGFDESRVDDGVKNSNEMYGGLTLNVTQVVFVNGDMDPWSTISVIEDRSYRAPAVVIPRETHCSDLYVGRDASEELKEAQKHIKSLVKHWIGLGDYTKPWV